MSIESKMSEGGNVITIMIPVEFDFNSHREFRDIYTQKDKVRYVLDFAKTEYIDSSALGMLLLMREEVTARDGTIEIVNCRGTIKNLLVMSNFHQLFNVA